MLPYRIISFKDGYLVLKTGLKYLPNIILGGDDIVIGNGSARI